jgi:hypothetical protein
MFHNSHIERVLCWCYMKYRTLHQGGVGNDWNMCVGFIFWDVEINNDFEDITLATRVNLCITCYY